MFTSVDSTMRGDVGFEAHTTSISVHASSSGVAEYISMRPKAVRAQRKSHCLICSATILQHHLQDPTRSHSMSDADDTANKISDEPSRYWDGNSRICCLSFHVPISLMRYTAICTVPKSIRLLQRLCSLPRDLLLSSSQFPECFGRPLLLFGNIVAVSRPKHTRTRLSIGHVD